MVAPVRILHCYRGTALAPNRAGGWLNSLGNDRSDPHHLITVRATESAWARLLVLLYQHDLSRTGMLHHFCGTRTLPKVAPVDGSALASEVLPRPFACLR